MFKQCEIRLQISTDGDVFIHGTLFVGKDVKDDRAIEEVAKKIGEWLWQVFPKSDPGHNHLYVDGLQSKAILALQTPDGLEVYET